MSAERMPHDESPLSQPLKWLTEQTLRSPGAVLWGTAIVSLVAILITINGLKFKTSRLDLLNPESRYNKRWLAYLDEFGGRDDAVIVVRSHDPAAVTIATEELARELSGHPELFDSIFWRRDLSRLKAKGLHFLPTEELQRLAGELRQATQAADSASRLGDPAAALVQLNDRLQATNTLSAPQREQAEREYAQVARMLMAAASASDPSPIRCLSLENDASNATAAGIKKLVDGLAQLESQHLTADEGRMGFVLLRLAVTDSGFARGSAAIGKLREIIADVKTRHPETQIGLSGMPVIEYDEMQVSQWDMLWTNVASLVVCVLLFVAGYGGIRHAGMATIVLLVGIAWSFGFVTLAVGHLNILSSAFGIVLIGLGIDFGIHYVASYLRMREDGLDTHTSLVRSAAEVGPGVVTSGMTIAAAFFMAGLTQFVGVRELGIVAGGGILLCVLAAVVVLPPVILLFDRHQPVRRLPAILPVASWFTWLHRRPAVVLPLAVVATGLALAGVTRLWYDHNLIHLQPSHVESVDIEREIFTSSKDSVWFAVSMCDSRQELKRRKAIFERLPSVAKTEEIVSLVPEPDARRQQFVAEIHSALVRLFEDKPAGESPVALASKGLAEHPDARARLASELRRAAELLNRGLPYETPVAQSLARIGQSLSQIPPQHLAAALDGMRQEATRRFRQSIEPLKALASYADPASPTASDLPRELADRFIGRTNKHLLKVYAHGDIWDMDRLKQFVGEVERVDPQITGHPIQTYYASRHMQMSYVFAGIYALFAVFALILVDFRSIRYSLLAMVPLAMGFLQMCGLIGWFGIPLNAANLISLPLILGIGVDDGVHLVHEMRRQKGRFRLNDSTGIAVILISTTTMASFSCLILARHQGLRSLGQVLTLGLVCCLSSSIVVFPALLTWLTRGRKELAEEESPATSSNEEAKVPRDIAVEREETAVPALAQGQVVEHAAAEAGLASSAEETEPAADKTDANDEPAPEIAPLVGWMSVESFVRDHQDGQEPAERSDQIDPELPCRIIPRRRAG